MTGQRDRRCVRSSSQPRIVANSCSRVRRGVYLTAVLLNRGRRLHRSGLPYRRASTCNPPLFGLYADVWFNDRMALRARYVALKRDDRIDVLRGAILRRYDGGFSLLRAELIGYFGRGQQTRPFLGGSVGLRRLDSTVRCEPVSCAEAGFDVSLHSASGQNPVTYRRGDSTTRCWCKRWAFL